MGRLQSIPIFCMLFFVVLCGCQKEKEQPAKKLVHGVPQSVVEDNNQKFSIINTVKKMVLDNNKSKSVGKAFDEYRFFTTREWKETTAENQTVYVDFIGLLDAKAVDTKAKMEGVVDMAINVKFVIKPDGRCFVGMITLYDAKNIGRTYPLSVPAVMDAIYANKELPPL